MSLVITGATGQLGRRAAELLLDHEGVAASDIVLITRRPEALDDLAARGAAVRFGDFDRPETLADAFAGATRVLLISTDAVGARVPQHQNAIDAAKAAGASLIAYTSITNPVPDNPAGVVPDHMATEAALRASGVSWTFLRNGQYGEYCVPDAQAALASGTLAHNQGDGVTAYVSREDCAAAAVAVLAGGDEHADKAYDITGPELLGATQLAELYASVGGKPVTAVAVDDDALIAGIVEHGIPEVGAVLIASFGRAIREGKADRLSDDVETLTGRPPITLREVLTKVL